MSCWGGGPTPGRPSTALSCRSFLGLQWHRPASAVALPQPDSPRPAPGLPRRGRGQPHGRRHGQDPRGRKIRPRPAGARAQGGHPQPRLQEQAAALLAEVLALALPHRGAPPADRERRRERPPRQRAGRRRAVHARPQSAGRRRPGGQEPGEGGSLRHQAVRLRHPRPRRRLPVPPAEGPAEPAPGRQDQSLRERTPAAPRHPARAGEAPAAGELRFPDQVERPARPRGRGADRPAQSKRGHHRVRAPAAVPPALRCPGGPGAARCCWTG